MPDADMHSVAFYDEIESTKEQIKNLKDALLCNEEEKQEIQKEYQEHLLLINNLRLEVEDWKSKKIRNLYLFVLIVCPFFSAILIVI